MEQIGQLAKDVEYVYVCDRGTDNFEVFCHLQQQNSDRVIRAKAKNRGLVTSAGESITLGKQLRQITSRGSCELQLRARSSQPVRTVKIEVLSGKALMPVPCYKNPWFRSLNSDPIPVNIVQVREVDAPEGVTPIECVLYTLLPVDTFEQLGGAKSMTYAGWSRNITRLLKAAHGLRLVSRRMLDAWKRWWPDVCRLDTSVATEDSGQR